MKIQIELVGTIDNKLNQIRDAYIEYFGFTLISETSSEKIFSIPFTNHLLSVKIGSFLNISFRNIANSGNLVNFTINQSLLNLYYGNGFGCHINNNVPYILFSKSGTSGDGFFSFNNFVQYNKTTDIALEKVYNLQTPAVRKTENLKEVFYPVFSSSEGNGFLQNDYLYNMYMFSNTDNFQAGTEIQVGTKNLIMVATKIALEF